MITTQDLIDYRIKHGLPIPDYYSKRTDDPEPKPLPPAPEPKRDQLEVLYERLELAEGRAKKTACRQITSIKVKRGLISPQGCAICGAGNAHTHHLDYNHPDDIVWLCPYHHYALHYAESAPGSNSAQFFKHLMNKNKPA